MLTKKIKRIGIIIVASLTGFYIFASYLLPKILSVPFAVFNSYQAQNDIEEINHYDFHNNIELFQNGRWINESDSLAGIEIKNKKWIIFYKGIETDSTDIYDYKVTIGNSNFADSEPNTGEFVTLTNAFDTLNYEVLGYNKQILSLLYLPRGNIHVYKPEK